MVIMSSSKDVYTDLPEDFFNDLVDESFIEEVVDNDDDEEDDPHLNRCLDEIKCKCLEILVLKPTSSNNINEINKKNA